MNLGAQVRRVLLSSLADRVGEEVRSNIDLRGNEGLLLKVDFETLDS
jgi:hypothetical protein